LLVRHGESVGNAEGIIQGQADYPLTDLGIRQAAATARRLSEMPLAAVYSSPLSRAFQTAVPIAAEHGIAPTSLASVQEYHFGEGTGLSFAEWRKASTVSATTGDPQHLVTPLYPGEEGRASFRERVCAAMWEVCERHAGDEFVVVVAHAGPIAVFVLDVLGVAYRRPVPLSIENCSVSCVAIREGRGVVETLNDTCHLDGSGT
jgi:broad specificity phosphatase PhoE